jgi:beta-glucosidase
LGLFDDPYRFSDKQREQKQWSNPEHVKAEKSIAEKSIVLLKNEAQLLPISRNMKTIALIGPFINAKSDNNGFWSYDWPDDSARIVSVWEGIKAKVSSDTKLLYAKGCNVGDSSTAGFGEAIETAKQADVVIMNVGEAKDMSGEAKSRSNIQLPGVQEELIKAIQGTGKPVVVMINAGRPLIFNWTADHVPAILYTWWLGTQAGNAIADVLFGDYNPSGKLPISFPLSEGQIPIYYNHFNTGRPATTDSDRFYRSAYIDLSIYPKFPFGYGLSYTKFQYGDIKLNTHKITPKDNLRATVVLKNTGNFDGEETVQLYIQDLVGSVVRPVKELRSFQKVFLRKGESKEITFTLTVNDLKFVDDNIKWVYEPGDFKLFIGGNSRDVVETSFVLEK